MSSEIQTEDFGILNDRLKEELLHHVVFPKTSDIFKALEICPLEETKVVILGQDPYHGAGQAHGLSFSVPASCKIPPSLRNIYKELERSLNLSLPHHGDLSEWARQGVLLLNTSLTVRSGMAGSHSKLGWSQFTDTVIRKVSDYQDHVVFLLWGSHAQSKSHLIDPTKHLILQSAHPSPLSAHRGFIGNNHFLMSNEFLKTHQLPAISWELLNSQIELFDS